MTGKQFSLGFRVNPITKGPPVRLAVRLHDLGAAAERLIAGPACWRSSTPNAAFVGVDGIEQLEPPSYASTEPAHQNREPYKVPTNIIPLHRLARRPPTPPAPSSSSLRFRVELYRLVYGAGMFVLRVALPVLPPTSAMLPSIAGMPARCHRRSAERRKGSPGLCRISSPLQRHSSAIRMPKSNSKMNSSNSCHFCAPLHGHYPATANLARIWPRKLWRRHGGLVHH